MIGGTDIIIPATGDPAALDICARIVRRYWPQARFEDAVTGEKYAQYGEIPLGCVRELLVYRDAHAESAWDADDANSPENSMLYLILSGDSITVVLDDPDAADMRSIVGSLRTSLEAAIQRTYAAAA
ncbi:MAG TPA: hypothetical protein PK867_15155 [Pirellulales bacterium]|nr:hypothetical protein [Pirellulales bacterium]